MSEQYFVVDKAVDGGWTSVAKSPAEAAVKFAQDLYDYDEDIRLSVY